MSLFIEGNHIGSIQRRFVRPQSLAQMAMFVELLTNNSTSPSSPTHTVKTTACSVFSALGVNCWRMSTYLMALASTLHCKSCSSNEERKLSQFLRGAVLIKEPTICNALPPFKLSSCLPACSDSTLSPPTPATAQVATARALIIGIFSVLMPGMRYNTLHSSKTYL